MNFEFIVDSREKVPLKKFTCEKYGDAKVEALYAGDFACRVNSKFIVGAERKTLMDLVNSISNKRLFKQIDKLHKTYPIILLILEGNMPTLRAELKRLKLKFNEKAFWGTLASIVVRDNIHIFQSANRAETVNMAHSIFTKIAEGKYRIPRRWKPKKFNKPTDSLELIPGVTNALAKKLIKKHGSIYNIASQTQKKLCDIEGVGPTLAKRIKSHLT